MSTNDKLISHYEELLKSKNAEIHLLQGKLIGIRKITTNPRIERITHFPPYKNSRRRK